MGTLPSFVALCVLVAACGGRTRNPGGAAPVDGIAGQAGSSGGACSVPTPDPPSVPGGPPASFGCAANVAGTWQERPCSCELWLRNPETSPVQAAVHLEFKAPAVTPSLSDEPTVQVSFPDPTGTWQDAWSSQAGAGTDFLVAAEGGVTSIRLGTSELALDPVALVGCAHLTATASVRGPWGTRLALAMSAAFSDAGGTLVSTSMSECAQPATHPTPMQVDAGASAGGPAR